MSTPIDPSDTAAIDQAIDRVLLAEREGRAAVAACAEQAAIIVAEAHARADRIARRTEQRMQHVSRIADRRLEQLLREFDEVPPMPGDDRRTAPAEADLERAIGRLVDEMVGQEAE